MFAVRPWKEIKLLSPIRLSSSSPTASFAFKLLEVAFTAFSADLKAFWWRRNQPRIDESLNHENRQRKAEDDSERRRAEIFPRKAVRLTHETVKLNLNASFAIPSTRSRQ